MRLWQATWDNSGELLIWGECVSSEDSPLKSNLGRIHTYSCSNEQLLADLNLLEFEPDGSREIELLLPTDDSGVLTSPHLILPEERTQTGKIRLEPWKVPALYFKPLPALAFLTSLPPTLPPGLKFDESLRFWLEATKLVLELLTRGRFIPGISQEASGFAAHWQAIISETSDRERLKILADGMPPICRALCQLDASKDIEPGKLLESFISHTADSLVRSFLRSHELFSLDAIANRSARLQSIVYWLKGLTSADPVLTGPAIEYKTLRDKLDRWSQPLLPVERHTSLKVGFKLLPPNLKEIADVDAAQENALWTLKVVLQSAANPNKELEADDFWQGNLGFLKQSSMSVESLEDFLLQELGRASSIFPELQSALETVSPSEISLTTPQAYQFLRNLAAPLEEAGFTLILPDWWNTPTTKLGLHLTVSSPEQGTSSSSRPSVLGLNQLVDFSWQIALGSNLLSAEEFELLVKKNLPLVQVNGQWVELQPEKITKALDFLKNQSKTSRIRALEALRLGLGIKDEEISLPVVGLSASGWLKQLLDADVHNLEQVQQPEKFLGDLRPYQLEGLTWLNFLGTAGIGGCLADDMGLGKTIQLLALLLKERDERQANIQTSSSSDPNRAEPTLLIVPMSILDNWQHEASRFTPGLKTYLHHGSSRLTGQTFLNVASESDIVITTYSLAYRDEALFSKVNWARIALDEAQNIKNLGAKQTQAVRRIAQSQMADAANPFRCHRLALTGTPLENRLEELWSIFEFLNPGYLGTISEFRSRFILPIERFRDKQAAQALSELVRPFILRRLKSDPKVINDLPEKMEMEVLTALTEEQAALYQSIVENMLPQVDETSGIHRKGLVLATITKLKQICNHPVLFSKDQSALADRSGKLARLEELLEEIIAEGDKVLIFTQYAQMGMLLKPYLQERFDKEVLFLHGGLSKAARNQQIDRFQRDDGPPIFILSLKAGGFGLNLTQANQVIHYDQWWNPAVEDQATDRAYRIGQKRNVQVRKFICKGTLEEKISDLLRQKKNLAQDIVGSTKSLITQLSTSELRNLLQLTAESGES